MEPETLQSVLQEAGMQVDMKDLENPTEEFMVYLITEYLNKFKFDGYEIAKSTIEQFECLSSPDSASDAIKVINLYSALTAICNEIFLKDICLTDITSPGPKRARRHIKILFNFFAYVKSKMVEYEMAFADLNNQEREIEEMIDRKDSIVLKIGATIDERENKLELKQQLQQEIEQVSSDIEINSKKLKELENRTKDVMIDHQEALKQCNDLKARAIELHQITTELRLKIVKSPEEYEARSKELKKILEVKKEERQVLNDSITRKKLQIKNNENAQELVKELNDNFTSNISKTFKKLKETSTKLESVQKELNLLQGDIAKWSTIQVNDSPIVSKEEDLKGHERLLFELDNQYTDKERESQSQKVLLDELKTEFNKKDALLKNELKTISIIQQKNSDLLKIYKEHFQNEISEEFALRETISRKLLKIDCKNL